MLQLFPLSLSFWASYDGTENVFLGGLCAAAGVDYQRFCPRQHSIRDALRRGKIQQRAGRLRFAARYDYSASLSLSLLAPSLVLQLLFYSECLCCERGFSHRSV